MTVLALSLGVAVAGQGFLSDKDREERRRLPDRARIIQEFLS